MMTYIIVLIVGPRYDHAGRWSLRNGQNCPQPCGCARPFRTLIIGRLARIITFVKTTRPGVTPGVTTSVRHRGTSIFHRYP